MADTTPKLTVVVTDPQLVLAVEKYATQMGLSTSAAGSRLIEIARGRINALRKYAKAQSANGALAAEKPKAKPAVKKEAAPKAKPVAAPKKPSKPKAKKETPPAAPEATPTLVAPAQ